MIDVVLVVVVVVRFHTLLVIPKVLFNSSYTITLVACPT